MVSRGLGCVKGFFLLSVSVGVPVEVVEYVGDAEGEEAGAAFYFFDAFFDGFFCESSTPSGHLMCFIFVPESVGFCNGSFWSSEDGSLLVNLERPPGNPILRE